MSLLRMTSASRWVRWSLIYQSRLYHQVPVQFLACQVPVRRYCTPPPNSEEKRQSIFSKIFHYSFDKVNNNENIKKFKEEMRKLEEQEALARARQKYQSVEEEFQEKKISTKKAFEKITDIQRKVSAKMDETEIFQKASKFTEEAGKQAQKVGQTISQKGEEFTKTQTYKTISETAQAVKQEFGQGKFAAAGSRVYRAPMALRMRMERDPEAEARIIQANNEATGVVLHKDSKFSQSWQNFRDNNKYINQVLEWKMRLDESQNPLVRASYLVKEKAAELFGGVFQPTELSEALTEICKMDQNFNKERFLLEMEYDVIPNVLEAMIRPDMEILQDWCYERVFKVISVPLKQMMDLGNVFRSKILDVDNVDLLMGKLLDEGPVLVISFLSQQIHCICNAKGEVIEGDLCKVLRVNNVWVLCRDQEELDPRAAWRILELSSSHAQQFM